VTSTGRVLILTHDTSAAEHTKLPALTAKTADGEPTASSSAPTAGPAITTRLSIVSFSELAATRSSSPTTDGIVAATAGL